MKKWLCLAVVLLCGRSLVAAFDLAAYLKVGASYPFYSGGDYQSWLRAQEAAFLATEGYPVAYGARWSADGVGVSAGVSLAVGVADFLVLQPEILVMRLGGTSGFNDPLYYGTLLYIDRLMCVNGTLLAAARFGRGKSRISLFAGPGVAFRWGLVDLRIFEEGYLIGEGTYADTEFAPSFPNVAAGVAGTYYLRNRLLLTLEGRCTMGLAAVMNKSWTGLGDWRTNGVQLMVGIGRVIAGKAPVQRSNVR